MSELVSEWVSVFVSESAQFYFDGDQEKRRLEFLILISVAKRYHTYY